ncbi:hypothetical protein CAPTEDRAFT_159396 [Capitella teleta]|uniref:Importin N-terminal domain-containing protein n=1 Tax=Capitella teleta TaxID=283909 RepID=R7T6S0_CAPTE|nr:hypothetical protein CAPTEDRAFT_159396 [Capitella teleta]|eukprot:ELT89259.1 hypothetical protein CAPTEDRAFT_159396 [Capitella teleta]
MAENLEAIFANLLVPDTAVIQQATQQLKGLMNDPALVPALCQVLSTSQTPQVRQYAAVLLRRKILRRKQWTGLGAVIAQNIRQNLLQVMLQESEAIVRKSLAQLVATVAKHDLPQGRWPELFQFFQTYTSSQDPIQRELGMFVLSTVSGSAAEQLQPELTAILQLCAASLQDTSNHKIPFHAIQTLTSLVEVVDQQHLKAFQQLIPQILLVIQALITSSEEDLAVDALEIFDELVECEVGVIVPHIKTIMEFCLLVGANKQLGSKVRVKALSFISWIVRLKKKSIMKLRLINPILDALFPIICEAPADEDLEEVEDEDFAEDSHSAHTYATQVIDVMSLHLPPEKFIPPLMKHVEPALSHADPYFRKGGFLCMAVSAEGCSDHLKNRHLKSLLQCVYKGLSDASPAVRNAAMFALGQFSEHLQPNISKYSSELLPLLFECLTRATADITKDPRGVTKTYYALEMFCENLERDLVPYLPQLMEYLICTLTSNTHPHVKELAISAIAAAAAAAKEDLVPYFPKIIETLKLFLTPSSQEEPQLKVQVQALDTLGVLCRTMGEHFRPLVAECLQLALSLMDDASDPDLRRCIYGLLAALSTLLKSDMAPHLDTMVTQMVGAMKSTEGVKAHYGDEESRMFRIFDDVTGTEEEDIEEEDEEEEANDDNDVQGYSVGNAYLEEKGDACSALGELAINIGAVFMTHMETVFQESIALLEYPASELRESAIQSVGNLCIAVATVAEEANSQEARTALFTMLATVIPKLMTTVQEDDDRQVATSTIETLNEMLTKIKMPVIQCTGGSPDQIIALVKMVMQEKVACQDPSIEDHTGAIVDDDDEEERSEYDSVLLESAGDLIPTLAKVLGGEAFAPYFAGFLPDLIKKLKKAKTVAEKSFAVGTIGETMHALGAHAAKFSATLYPLFLQSIKDEDEEVRSNSVYALGVTMANGGSSMHSNYQYVSKNLLRMMKEEEDPRAMDNICAALCRMIDSKQDALPLSETLTAVLKSLPLTEDLEENITVYTCLLRLYSTKAQLVLPMLANLIKGCIHCLTHPPVKDELKSEICVFLHKCEQFHAAELHQVLSSLSPETKNQLQQLLAAASG